MVASGNSPFPLPSFHFMRMQSDPRNNHPSCLHIHWSQPPACSERQLSSLQHAFIHCHSSPVMFYLYPTRSNIHVRQDASGTLRISDKVCNTQHHITAHNYTKPVAVAPWVGRRRRRRRRSRRTVVRNRKPMMILDLFGPFHCFDLHI